MKSMKQHGLNRMNNYKNNSGHYAEKDWPSKKLRKLGRNSVRCANHRFAA
jgi:hypothetical protein